VQGLLTGVLDGTVTAAGTAAIDPGRADPSAVAEVLVAWANRQGGQDNITAALARVQPG
jgi:serine/threonine protein phosphatase PrpC